MENGRPVEPALQGARRLAGHQGHGSCEHLGGTEDDAPREHQGEGQGVGEGVDQESRGTQGGSRWLR